MGLKMWGSWSKVWFMTAPVFSQPLGLTHVTLSHIKLVNKLSFLIMVQLDDFKDIVSRSTNIVKTIYIRGIVYKMLSRPNSISPRACVPGGVMPGVFSPVSRRCVTSNWAGIKLSGSHVTCVLCSLHETLSQLRSSPVGVQTWIQRLPPSTLLYLPAHVYNAESMALTMVKMVAGDSVVMPTHPWHVLTDSGAAGGAPLLSPLSPVTKAMTAVTSKGFT